MANNKSQEELKRVQNNIENAYAYFKDNYNRFHMFRRFIFKESITADQRAMLQKLSRPVVEFNILEAYISRLLGEFAMQEPSIEVSPSEGVPVQSQTIDIVEGFIRHKIYEADKDGFSFDTYKDMLSGGFGVAKVWTDYENDFSFKQDIYLGRTFDPTLCGFDPMARTSHKGDGKYSFEIYPMTEADFDEEFSGADKTKMKYSMSESQEMQGFNWSYKDKMNRKIILVADYYEKKKKKVRITELSNGKVMRQRDYEKLQKFWEENQIIEQIPAVVSSRWTMLESVAKYRLTEGEVLDYTETDYTYLPHVFFDGNSINLTQESGNSTYQMTRPYVYHAMGVQNLKNFAGQSLANYLENMIQHKFIVMKEAIPQEQDYLEALNDIQRANTVVVNAYSENNPDKPIPNPIREVINQPAPPEVMAAFQVTDPTTQTILGSYASNLGKNDNDLSGKAIIESSTAGNAASMPYVVGYLAGLTQIANIIVDLMPKYILGQRTLPVVGLDGDKTYANVNEIPENTLDYEQRAIKVNIEAGVNFQVQKNQALQQIISLMGASQEFNAFMNSPKGLPIIVKNLTIYGADELVEAVPEWMAQQEQQQQQQQQMMQQQQQQQMQTNPQMIRAQAEMMKAQSDIQQQQIDNQFEVARLATEKELADAKILEAESKITQDQIDSAVRLEQQQTSLQVHGLEAASKMAEIQSRQHDDRLKAHDAQLKASKLQHEINKGRKDDGQEV